MSAAPDLTAVKAYLIGISGNPMPSWPDDQITNALAAETQAQRNACTIPQDLTDPNNPVDDYPDDLIEALKRRVAVNLANRNLPLGIQTTVSEFGGQVARIGGRDREVIRLEAPYRRLVCG